MQKTKTNQGLTRLEQDILYFASLKKTLVPLEIGQLQTYKHINKCLLQQDINTLYKTESSLVLDFLGLYPEYDLFFVPNKVFEQTKIKDLVMLSIDGSITNATLEKLPVNRVFFDIIEQKRVEFEDLKSLYNSVKKDDKKVFLGFTGWLDTQYSIMSAKVATQVAYDLQIPLVWDLSLGANAGMLGIPAFAQAITLNLQNFFLPNNTSLVAIKKTADPLIQELFGVVASKTKQQDLCFDLDLILKTKEVLKHANHMHTQKLATKLFTELTKQLQGFKDIHVLGNTLFEQADQTNVSVPTTIALQIDAHTKEDMQRYLKQNNVFFRQTNNRINFDIALYNTKEDIQDLLVIIEEYFNSRGLISAQ